MGWGAWRGAGGKQARFRPAPKQPLPPSRAHRCFGLIKYTDLQRNAQLSVYQLLSSLHTITLPRYQQNRAHQLVGRTKSDQRRQEERVQRIVEEIVARGGVVLVPGGAPGLAWVYDEAGELSATVCLGDLSCSCGYSGEEGEGAVRKAV